MEQQTALNILKAGHNVFLTGSAGTGKSYTLKQYVAYLRRNKIPVAVTASTGIAATQLNGSTIHSWAGIGIKDYLTALDISKVVNNHFKSQVILKTKVLIIDEISMLHLKQLGLVNTMLKAVRKNNLPFGGIQVILTGDFFQLPPVGKDNETNREKFCFMSPAWAEAAFKVCYLDKQFRQSEGDLIEVLNSIRSQTVTQDQIDLLLDTELNDELDSNPLHLFTHNVSVDLINAQKLNELQEELHTFKAHEIGPDALLKTLKNSVRAPDVLELKIGAKVMFVKNHPDGTYANGTQGTVDKFVTVDNKKIPVIVSKGRSIIAHPESWSIDDENGKPLAIFEQIPLRLAYAITIHKSQGMTLQEAEINLSRTFEMGQGYVALSRLQSIEGLRLTGINASSLLLDPLAIKADTRFQELSSEIEDEFVEINLEAHQAFLQSVRPQRRRSRR